MTVRVYALASELGLDPTELAAIGRELGVKIDSHRLTSLTVECADAIRRFVAQHQDAKITHYCSHCGEVVITTFGRLPPEIRREKCRECGNHHIMVGSERLFPRRPEPSWFERKLANAKRFLGTEDAADLVYSELFVAIEILLRDLYNAAGQTPEEDRLAFIAERLHDMRVLNRKCYEDLRKAIAFRNQLVHGAEVDLRQLPIEFLLQTIDLLRWYFQPKQGSSRARVEAISDQSVVIEVNANKEGDLCGAVGTPEIAAALTKVNIGVTPEQLRLQAPLKAIGLYTVEVHLADGVGELKVWIVPSQADEQQTPTADG